MASPGFNNSNSGNPCHGPATVDPTGGATIDANARAAVVTMLTALRGSILAGAQIAVPAVPNGFSQAFTAIIANVSGGATIDVEARVAINGMLAAMREANMVAVAGGNAGSNPSVWDPKVFMHVHGAALADVTTGAVVDTQLRVAVNAMLAALRSDNIIAQN